MSYKELEVGYQDLRAASFYIGDESEGPSLLSADLTLGETLPTTYDYVYTSANSPTKTTHPNCPICLQVVSEYSCLLLFYFPSSFSTLLLLYGLCFLCLNPLSVVILCC